MMSTVFFTESGYGDEQSNYMNLPVCVWGILSWEGETALRLHFPSHIKYLNSSFHLHLKVSGRLK